MRTMPVAGGAAGRAGFLGGALCSHMGPQALCSLCCHCIDIARTFEEGVPRCHFAVGPKNVVVGPDSKNSRKESREEGKTEAGESGVERNGIFKEEDDLAEREKLREGRRESKSGRGNDYVVLNEKK